MWILIKQDQYEMREWMSSKYLPDMIARINMRTYSFVILQITIATKEHLQRSPESQ